jgi:hypothetical protein
MVEAAKTSETLVNFYHTTRRYNPEDSHLCTHRRENLKSYVIRFGDIIHQICNVAVFCFVMASLNKHETKHLFIRSLQSTSKNSNLMNIFIKLSCRQQFLYCLVQEGTTCTFTTLNNILNYTLHSYSFSFVMNVSNQRFVEMIVVNFLSHYFLTVWIYVSFLYYNFMAVYPSSVQRFILIS